MKCAFFKAHSLYKHGEFELYLDITGYVRSLWELSTQLIGLTAYITAYAVLLSLIIGTKLSTASWKTVLTFALVALLAASAAADKLFLD